MIKGSMDDSWEEIIVGWKILSR